MTYGEVINLFIERFSPYINTVDIPNEIYKYIKIINFGIKIQVREPGDSYQLMTDKHGLYNEEKVYEMLEWFYKEMN